MKSTVYFRVGAAYPVDKSLWGSSVRTADIYIKLKIIIYLKEVKLISAIFLNSQKDFKSKFLR
jgi:hypothetical protein